MKAFLLAVIFVFLAGVSAFAQARWGYIDMQTILNANPDYVSAQKQINALSLGFQNELDNRQAEIDRLTKEYRAQFPLFTDVMRKQSENEISQKEKELMNFQSAKFGAGGEIDQQRNKLIQPIQDRAMAAIQAVARRLTLDKIEERAGAYYVNPQYDRTNDVIRQMGLTPPADK